MTPRRNLKHRLFVELATVNRALGTPARLEILEQLAQAEQSVEALARRVGLTTANASQHLRVLRRCGLVASRRAGQFVFYRLTGDEVVRLVASLHAVAARISPTMERLIESYRRETDALEPIPAQELMARSRAGLVTVIDVRPPDEFAAGHVPGAVNIPLTELEARVGEIPGEREAVAYCRGVLCIQSMQAVGRLRAAGLRARRLEYGLPEWRAAGYPVEGKDRAD